MKQHILAFGATALDASGGDVQLVAVPEQAFTISGGNNFQIPKPLQVFRGFAGGIGITRARINTGSLRARGFPQLNALNATILPPTPPSVANWFDYPVTLQKEEDFRIDVTNGAANDVVCLQWVTPDPIENNINTKDLRWIRFTVAGTGVKLAWSAPMTMVFQDLLEGGVYDIYGLAFKEATTIAARLILQGEFYRPGCLGQALNTAFLDRWNDAATGKWASFNTYSPPQVEAICSAAGALTTPQGWILCGKSMAQTNTDNR